MASLLRRWDAESIETAANVRLGAISAPSRALPSDPWRPPVGHLQLPPTLLYNLDSAIPNEALFDQEQR